MKPAAACSTYPRMLTGLYHQALWQPLLVGVSTISATFFVIRLLQVSISATYFISDDHPVTDACREFGIRFLP